MTEESKEVKIEYGLIWDTMHGYFLVVKLKGENRLRAYTAKEINRDPNAKND